MGVWEITCQLRTWGALGHEWRCWRPSRAPCARFSCSKTPKHFRKHKSCPSKTFGGVWSWKYLHRVVQKPQASYPMRSSTFSPLEWSFRLQPSPKVVLEQLLCFWKCLSVLEHKKRAQGAREGHQHGLSSLNAPHVLNWHVISQLYAKLKTCTLNWHVMSQSPIFVCKVKNMHSFKSPST